MEKVVAVSDHPEGEEMRYAETGFNLEVDLSRGSIDRVETDPKDTELYLGGLGTNAKILWDRVPPEVEPFSEDNLLIFSTGLLCGTPAIGCNRTIVTTISPQTKLMAFSMMGGFLGAGAEVRRLRQGDPPRQVPGSGLPVDPQRQGGDSRRHPPARARARSRPPS